MARNVVRSPLGARNNFLAAISYLGVLCFVPMALARDDEYVYFHAKQGLILWAWTILTIFALHVPVLGKWIFGFSAGGIMGLSLLGLTSVMFRRAWRLPLIAQIADRV